MEVLADPIQGVFRDNPPLGARALDDGDETGWRAVRDSNPRLPD